MSSYSFKTDLIYSNFDELLKQTHFDFSSFNFNNTRICNSLLKIYDEGNRCLKVGEDEKAYLLLVRYFDGVLKLRASQMYKTDKNYVDSMISPTSFKNILDTLENLKENIKKRYDEKEKAMKNGAKSSIISSTDEEAVNLKPIEKIEKSKANSIDKKHLDPKEFFDLLKQVTNKKYLIIDTRLSNEYDFSHMNLDLILNEENKKLISYINIPNDIIENVVWNLNESLKKYNKKNEINKDQTVSQAFELRADYDHLIIFDQDSTYNTLKSESKLAILKRAIYEYDTKKLKNEPIILDGGWNGWITFYPGLTASNKSVSVGLNLNNLVNNQNDKETSQNSIKKILDFDYPELMNLKNPIVPTTPLPKPVQEVKNESKVETVINRPQHNIANTNKSEEKFTNESIDTSNITINSLSKINASNSKPNSNIPPSINRLNKPSTNNPVKPSAPPKTTIIDSENIKNLSSTDLKNTDDKNKPNKGVFMLSDTSSDEEEEIIKNETKTEKQSKLTDLSKTSEQIIEPPTMNETDSSNINSYSHINSSNSKITKFIPPSSKSTIQVQPKSTDDKASSNLNNKIFNSIYVPNRISKPFQTPYMREGAKVLNSTTGLFSYQPTENTTSAPAKTQSNNQQPDREIKFVPPSLRQTQNKANHETKTRQLNDTFPREKSNLKRTFSQPNIANMNDEILIESDDENESISLAKEKDIMKRNLVDPVGKPTGDKLNDLSKISISTVKNNPTSLNISNNSTKTTNFTPKPNVNRNSKPMPEHIVQLRLQELQPVYGNTHPGLTGIKNLGNTCFMNSILQCLVSIEKLVNYFINGDYKRDLNRENDLGFRGEIADEFSIIVQAIWNGRYRIISPKRFKFIIGQFNQQFISNEQQDAQELLLFLLDGLHEDLNRIDKRPRITDKDDENDNLSDRDAANLAWKIHLSINNSIIVDLFQGQFKSTVTCSFCNKRSVKFDAFMYLTLPVPSTRCNIYECLDLFLKPENMSGESKWKCPRCKQYRDAVKKIDIWKLPPLLIIHLKRFKYHGLWRDKINTNVDYPIEDLNLDEFIINNENIKSKNYRLYAMSNHSGTLDGGHYTALCRHFIFNKWFKFDDTNVTEVNDYSALKSPSSYILFYSQY